MRNENFLSKGMIKLMSLSFIISLFVLLFACNPANDNNGSNTATTTTPAPAPLAAGVQEFYHFKIDSAVLVDSFFKKSATFKKIIFNFKINDYSDVPKSLSLVGHGAKNQDDLIDYNPEELVRLTNKEQVNADNLLYSTMELSLRKIENLVGANGTGKSYSYLVFIPYIETKNGQRHLSYKVQKRPIDPNADEPTENLNPCPPFKPND
jgi:hypothetical protein